MKSTFLKRIILLFSTALIVYMLVVLVAFLFYNANEKTQQYDENAEFNLHAVADNADQKLENAIFVATQIANDNDVKDFVNQTSSSEYGYSALVAVQRIRDIISNHAFAFSSANYDFAVISPNINVVATANETYSYRDYLKSIGADEVLFTETVNRLQNTLDDKAYELYSSTLKGNERKNTILMLLNEQNVPNNILVSVTFERSYFFENNEIFESFAVECLSRGQTILGVGQDKEEIVNNPRKTYTVKSNRVKDVEYKFYLKEYDFFYNNKFFLINIIYSIIFLLLCITVVAFRTKKMYGPMYEIVNEIKGDSATDGDDVDVIARGYRGLKIKYDILSKENCTNVTVIRESLIKEILNGSIDSDKIHEKLNKYSLEYLNDTISVTVVEFIGFEDVKNVDTLHDSYEIKNRIITYFRGNLPFSHVFEILSLNDTQFAVLVSGYGLEEIKKILIDEMGVVEEYYGIKLKSATGCICDNVLDINKSFVEALLALKQVSFNDSNVINVSDIELKSECYYPIEVEHLLIETVLKGEEEKTRTMLANIVVNNDIKNMEELKQLMLMTIKRILHVMKVDLKKEYLDSMEYDDEKLSNVRAVFCNLATISQNEKQEGKKSLWEDILIYIDNNYMNDISLTEIAQKFNISTGYVCQLFRENNAFSFKEYLNRYRIEKAKLFLLRNEYKVNTVGEMVGFMSPISFNRVFKKYEGITPGAYKEKIMSEDNVNE